jgi:hypothetical protein
MDKITITFKFSKKPNNNKVGEMKEKPVFTKIHPYYLLTNSDRSTEYFQTLKEISEAKGFTIPNIHHLTQGKVVKTIDFTVEKCEVPYEYTYKGINSTARNIRDIAKHTNYSVSTIMNIIHGFLNNSV